MISTLVRHPESLGGDALSVSVQATRPSPGLLTFHYIVTGDVTDVRLEPRADAERADDLWRTTCFEAFVRAPESSGYYELNFAPSTRWAAYRLTDYRAGMKAEDLITPPLIDHHVRADGVEVRVRLALGATSDLPLDRPWRLGVSAVLEHRAGAMSYWALAHPPGKPDFHHPDSFVLELPAPDPA